MRAEMMTCAPSRANASATARPRPRRPPVTRAILPLQALQAVMDEVPETRDGQIASFISEPSSRSAGRPARASSRPDLSFQNVELTR